MGQYSFTESTQSIFDLLAAVFSAEHVAVLETTHATNVAVGHQIVLVEELLDRVGASCQEAARAAVLASAVLAEGAWGG
jgi:hypothetical protein